MSEFEVCPDAGGDPPQCVLRLQFAPGGELFAWVGSYHPAYSGPRWTHVDAVYARAASGTVSTVYEDAFAMRYGHKAKVPEVSPDGRYVAIPASMEELESVLVVTDRTRPQAEPVLIATRSYMGYPRPLFHPNGKDLWVVVDTPLPVGDTNEDNPPEKYFTEARRWALARFAKAPRRADTTLNFVMYQAEQVEMRCGGWTDPRRLEHCESDEQVALSPCGRYVASGSQSGAVAVEDLEGTGDAREFPRAAGMPVRRDDWDEEVCEVTHLGFSPDGARLALIAEGQLSVVPLSGEKRWAAKAKGVTGFAFHPTGATVCAVFDSGHARTFDATTGAILKELRWGKKPLYSVAFAPDGLTCAAGGLGGRVVIWDVDA
jgi:WD40 repeat protein